MDNMLDDVPEDIRRYADENRLHFDLRSPVVQRMLRLRMQHPEWKEQATHDQAKRYPELHWRHWQG